MNKNISRIQSDVQIQLRLMFDDESHVSPFIKSCVASNDTEREANSEYIKALQATATLVYRSKESVQAGALKSLCHELNEALDTHFDTSTLTNPFATALRSLRTLGSAFLFIFVCYLVIGGIWAGYSNLASEFSRALILSALALCIIILAALEGSQISVSILKSKDLKEIEDDHPGAYQLRNILRSDIGVKKYLAGRQMMVVLLVFIIAQVTTFPKMDHWPLTQYAFPDFFYPWIHLVLFKLGVLGAIFVLWFGQLIPQFLAATNPQKFLDIPGINHVVKLAWLTESFGITQPVDWFTKGAAPGRVIPLSNKENFEKQSRELGYGLVSTIKNIDVSADGVCIETHCTVQTSEDLVREVVLDNVWYKIKDFQSDSTTIECLTDEQINLPHSLPFSEKEQVDHETGLAHKQFRVTLANGHFAKNTVIIFKNTTWLTNCDSLIITHSVPALYHAMRLNILNENNSIAAAQVSIAEHSAALNEFKSTKPKEAVFSEITAEHGRTYETVVLYPKQLSQYEYRWQYRTGLAKSLKIPDFAQ